VRSGRVWVELMLKGMLEIFVFSLFSLPSFTGSEFGSLLLRPFPPLLFFFFLSISSLTFLFFRSKFSFSIHSLYLFFVFTSSSWGVLVCGHTDTQLVHIYMYINTFISKKILVQAKGKALS
jgi:hypothetical protein